MVLKFLGSGSGFADEHTSAYFTTAEKEVVIIDCPVSAFQKLKKIDFREYEKFYILMTHTHGDHIGGLGLFVQYSFFVFKKPVIIIAPSQEVFEDIRTVLNIEGVDKSWYEIATVDKYKHKKWLKCQIATKHSPQLNGKCFGYQLRVKDTNVIYTGDTSTLEPFRHLITENSELYVDISVDYGQIHLKLEDAITELCGYAQNNVKVYLIHLDEVEAAKKVVEKIPNIEVIC